MNNLKEEQEDYLGKLWQQIEAAYQKLGRVDGAEKVRVNQEIEDLQAEIQRRNSKLNISEVSEGNSNPWKKDIHKINFKKAKEIFDKILKQYEQDQLTACFLLQDSRTLGGKWCLEMLKQILKETGDWNDPYKITFLSHHELNGKQFLDLIKLEDSLEDLETYKNKVIDRICGKIRSGSVILFQIEIYFSPTTTNNFLRWFIQDFWTLLVNRTCQLKREYPLVKLVAVISATSRLKKEPISEICCDKLSQFQGTKILELPLPKQWTQSEIENWLLKFSRLNDMGIASEKISEMSNNIYNDTRGKPSDVYSEIEKTITTVQQSQTNR